MTDKDYLIQHGWREDRTRAPFKWSDPENRETRYTLENAFEKQAHREAARLHTALAALELAQAALEAVTRIGGNLSDEGIEAVGGVHDAKSRALMVVIARTEARRGLEQIQAVMNAEVKK